MTSTANIHTLVAAFAAFALGACAPDAPPVQKGPKKKPVASAEPEPATPGAQPPADVTPAASLTSKAPAQPRSILDGPVVEAADGVPDALAQLAEAPHGPEPERPAIDPGDVHIDRFVLATGVEQREPADDRDVFEEGTPKIFAFVQLDNTDGEPFELHVHFEEAGSEPLPYGIALDVPTAPRWRTWAYTRIQRAPGTYRAVLRTADGQDIASREFQIVARDELDVFDAE